MIVPKIFWPLEKKKHNWNIALEKNSAHIYLRPLDENLESLTRVTGYCANSTEFSDRSL